MGTTEAAWTRFPGVRTLGARPPSCSSLLPHSQGNFKQVTSQFTAPSLSFSTCERRESRSSQGGLLSGVTETKISLISQPQ